ncbi:hypothetical protein ACIHCQ_16915 [Streptomyces sp. NPDC052236]|uniref:hypothetical protein n=1 Tax=Streptomyces sp. NPDC052236 TaxID=3365686 RepID=UPI0037D7360C
MSGEEKPSRTAGGCVLVVLAGAVVAVVFAVPPAAGVLSVWTVGVVALWRAARRMSDLPAAPSPKGVAPDSDIDAARRLAQAKAVYDPNGVLCALHPVRDE